MIFRDISGIVAGNVIGNVIGNVDCSSCDNTFFGNLNAGIANATIPAMNNLRNSLRVIYTPVYTGPIAIQFASAVTSTPALVYI